MAFTYQVVRSVTRYNAANQPLPETPAQVAANVTGTQEIDISTTVATAATNLLITIAFPVSATRVVIVQSDVAMTVKVNSSSAPSATLTLVAGIPQMWATGDAATNILGTTTVTALYATNAGAVDGTLTVNVLNP